MEKVSDTTTSELERFWQELVPVVHGEKPCMYRHGHHDGGLMSYKDFYAHAHCAAAYLMNQGLNHGDSVVILSGNTADYLILDLALQYLGAINITLPTDVHPEDLTLICERYEARFIFVPDSETLLRHGQLHSIKSRLSAILVGTDEMEGLDTQKLIAFDRLVAIGKTAWREGAALLKERKHKVRPSDLYALVYPEDGARGDFEPMSFLSLIENIEDAHRLYGSRPDGAVVALLQPFRILQRSYATYGGMRSRIPIWIFPLEAIDSAFLSKVRPDIIVADPEQLATLYQALPGLIGKEPNAVKSARKSVQKAHEVINRRVEAESQGKKNPFLNRLRYRFSNLKTYSRAKLALGGKLEILVCDTSSHEDLDRDAAVFFKECGLKIEQPKTVF